MNIAQSISTRLLAAGLLFVQPLLLATASPAEPVQGAKGFVVPSQVKELEPFTFAASGVVEGEVVSIQKTDSEGTVEGEVIPAPKPDRLGRVFLPAGLAAGSYLLTRGAGKVRSLLTVEPGQPTAQAGDLLISNPPPYCNVKQGMTLHGQGFSGNAADLTVTVGGKDIPVLASTASELKTSALADASLGSGSIRVRNSATGKERSFDSFVFDLSAKLVQTRITNGSSTALEFTFKPAAAEATVKARILSGPVSFGGAAKEKQLMIKKGIGTLPLFADGAGAGKFQVAYDLVGVRPPDKSPESD